jgi:hypothetical protein
MKKKKKTKTVKAWALVSGGGALIGGGDSYFGYKCLEVFSTKKGAIEHMSVTRPKDRVVPCTIVYEI